MNSKLLPLEYRPRVIADGVCYVTQKNDKNIIIFTAQLRGVAVEPRTIAAL